MKVRELFGYWNYLGNLVQTINPAFLYFECSRFTLPVAVDSYQGCSIESAVVTTVAIANLEAVVKHIAAIKSYRNC